MHYFFSSFFLTILTLFTRISCTCLNEVTCLSLEQRRNSMEIKNCKIHLLKPYKKNAKKHSDVQIKNVAESIQEFGWQQPIVVDENYVIIIGHCRYEAAKLLKLDEVPVAIAKLDEEQANKLRLLDNKTNESEWDVDLLFDQVPELDFGNYELDWGLPTEKQDVEEDEFDIDEAMKEEAFVQYGDIFKCGRHFVMCGDSTLLDDVKRLMGGVQADLLLTDPPYNVDYEGTAGKIENDNMEDVEFREFLKEAFSNANDVMKPGASFYIWHADSEGFNFRGACHDVGWQVRQCLIWNKNTLVMGRQDYQWKHEPCLYGWKNGAAHKWYSGRSETTVLDYNKPKHNDLHPTMKPLDLFSYLIQNSTQGMSKSKKPDVVLDLFGGSGTTLIACEQLNRTCYTMELDPKYCSVLIRRWEEYTGQDAVKL